VVVRTFSESVGHLTAMVTFLGTPVIAQLVSAERGEIERQPEAVADVHADVVPAI
jgi:hypothetical protein